jgi:methyl-accepting chemotaxis protein
MTFSVRNKLFGGFGVIVVALVIAGVFAITQLKSVGGEADQLYSENLVQVSRAAALRQDMADLRSQGGAYVLDGFAQTGQHDEILQNMNELETAINQDLTDLQATPGLTSTQVNDLATAKTAVQQWLQARREGTIALTDAGDYVGAAQARLTGSGGDAYNQALDAVASFIDETDASAAAAHDGANSTQSQATTLMLALIVVATLIAGATAFFIATSITRGVQQAVKAAEGIAEGDLRQNVDITSRDEIGRLGEAFRRMIEYLGSMARSAEHIADGDLTTEVKPVSEKDTLGTSFKAMVHNLRELVGSMMDSSSKLAESKDLLAESADQASGASQQIASTIQQVATNASQVAEGSTQQAESAQQARFSVTSLAEAIDGIVAGVEQQSRAINEANRAGDAVSGSAEQMAQMAGVGSDLVNQTIEGIGQIQRTVDSASNEITKLGQQSEEIGKIVAVIDDIAAQTNLLALNAAIEAARAGEQGRGFAVVADEVRSLAKRVAGATKEIADLIAGVQRGVANSVKAMEEGRSEMDAGSQLASQAGQALESIVDSVNQVNSQIQEMTGVIAQVREVAEENSAATARMKEQTRTAIDSVSAIAGVAEENSAATEELSASAEEMSAAAEEMNAQVEEVTAATHALGAMADELKRQVSLFRLSEDAMPAEGPQQRRPGGGVERRTGTWGRTRPDGQEPGEPVPAGARPAAPAKRAANGR